MTIDYVVLLTSILTFGAPIVFSYLSKIIMPYRCLVITNDYDKQALQNNLQSERYILVDLDAEIFKVLTAEQRQQKPLTVGNEVVNVLPNCYYEVGSSVIENLKKVVKNKEMVLMSCDYMLLKSVCRCKITYTVPSTSYLKFAKGTPNYEDKSDVAISMIKTNKAKKLHVYNITEALENIVIREFDNNFFRKF